MVGSTLTASQGTTSVSITQTENFDGRDGIVAVTDAAGTSATTLGTITTVLLDGLTGGLGSGAPHNSILDNALGTLTVNHSDSDGAILDITNALTTTLALNLGADGINPNGSGHNWLVINDTQNEYSTVNLSLGNSNSYLQFNDNGLITLTTAAGNGALATGNQGPSEFNDSAPAAVNLDFSGLNGPNDITVNRGSGVNNDVFTLGNFGSNLLTGGENQTLTIENGNINNAGTINFGSGAYFINDAVHSNLHSHSYVNTAPNGAGLASGFPGAEQWAAISNAVAGDTLQFKGDSVENTFNLGTVGSIAAGIAASLTEPQHSDSTFQIMVGKGVFDTFVFDHAGTSTLNVSASDAMVELVGVNFHNAHTNPGGIITLA